jgi:hypothetical protein
MARIGATRDTIRSPGGVVRMNSQAKATANGFTVVHLSEGKHALLQAHLDRFSRLKQVWSATRNALR